MVDIIIIALILLGVAGVIGYFVKRKKSGQSCGYSCGCSGCSKACSQGDTK